jgi:hypothetical protein
MMLREALVRRFDADPKTIGIRVILDGLDASSYTDH